jgi:hypothetical protein
MTLGKLIEAVHAGTLPQSIFPGSATEKGHWAYETGLNVAQRRWVFLAYNGSLDAAKSLHDALHPGARLEIFVPERGPQGRPVWGVTLPGSDMVFGPDLARAWLLAILRAKEGES